MKRFIYISMLLVMTGSTVFAQNDRQFIREGNKLYRSHKYSQAENVFRKALSKNPHNPQVVYNLGCALMSQGNDSAAIVQFNSAARLENNKFRRAKSYHNIGVILQEQQNYSDAIEAYKNALRNNPNDNDTRYNYVLCKRLLKQQQKQNNNQSNNKSSKDNENKKDNQNKDKQDKNKNTKDKEDGKEKQQPKNLMDRENAEQLLNAAMQKEKATHERLKKAMQQPSRRKINKNW